MIQTLNNGKGLYVTLLAEEENRVALNKRSVFPKTGQYQTSTDYFRDMVTNGVLPVEFKLFSAPGVPSASGRVFRSENNIWCFTLNLTTNDDPRTPFLFTRNISGYSLGTPESNKNKLIKKAKPYGERGAIVVSLDGIVRLITLKNIAARFNPSGATNAVLRPGDGF